MGLVFVLVVGERVIRNGKEGPWFGVFPPISSAPRNLLPRVNKLGAGAHGLAYKEGRLLARGGNPASPWSIPRRSSTMAARPASAAA